MAKSASKPRARQATHKSAPKKKSSPVRPGPKGNAKPQLKPKSRPKLKPPVKAKPKPAPKGKPKPAPKGKPKPAPKGKPASQAKSKTSSRAPASRKRVTFDAKTLRAIKKGLNDERTELMAQLEDIEESAFGTEPSEASGEAGFDDDYADAGTATFEREKDLSIANNIQDLIDKINKALAKIEDGSYGLCESCGQPISADRLKALPHVLLCINCKKAEERR